MRQGFLQSSVVTGDPVAEPSLWLSELVPQVLSRSSPASPHGLKTKIRFG